MKNIIFSFLFLLFNVCASAQMSQIWGTVRSDGFNDKDISLYEIKNGETKEIAKTNLAEDGSFGFMFRPLQEGFYAIGWNDFTREAFPIYLKSGDKAQVAINHRTFDFIGIQTPENAILYKWIQMSDSVKYNSFHSMQMHTEFFPSLAKLAIKAEVFKKSILTKNTIFNRTMKQIVKSNLDLYAVNFLAIPKGNVFFKKEDLPAYYHNIKLDNDCVLNMLYGKRLMNMYADFAIPGRGTVDKKITAFENDHLKGAYILNAGREMPTTYASYLDFMKKYGQFFQTPYQKLIVEELGIKLYNKITGPKPAINFIYPDQNGKMVSLSDFKGKVVIVDIWATWCAPCKAEIPSLKKMEEEFKGKDVAFVSVTVDYLKDKQNWLNMLKDLDLKGIQLFAGGWTKITKDYEIKTIPRFMVFDKMGNVVSTDSPRPSDPKLKEMLEKELAKVNQ